MKSILPITCLLLSLAAADEVTSVPGATTLNHCQHDGRTRRFRLHVPATAARVRTPRPLVLCYHGGGSTAAEQEVLTGFSVLAETAGFIVAYPDGVVEPATGKQSFADGRGTTFAERDGVDDVAFAARIIDAVAAVSPVDRLRIHATGLSNGGLMSQRLGLQLSDRIASIAPVAANLALPLKAGFKPICPLAVLQLSGTADDFMPYGGGTVTYQGIPLASLGQVTSAEEDISLWAKANGCSTRTQVVERYATSAPDPRDGCTVTRIVHPQKAGSSTSAEVVLLRITGGGHTWPGSRFNPPSLGTVCRDLDATAEIWNFFAAHAKRSPALVASPTATPHPGTWQVSLAVAAIDDGGPRGLTFTWQLTGPGNALVQGNGTSNAYQVMATCRPAGAWRATVSIVDADGNTVRRSVDFQVAPVMAAPTALGTSFRP